MTNDREELNWHTAGGTKMDTPYERAVLGFKNYWYPACGAREVSWKPKPVKLLGEPIVLLRRNGKAYAIQDECPHRGARMALGKYEFPGSDTISCRFHGFTYDVTNGRCVAALTDGPDSPVVGKIRIRTFPVEERKGIIWIWMGKGAPVPLEEDVPKLLLRDDTLVRFRYGTVDGNWRFHSEGACGGHFQMLHRDAFALLRYRWFANMQDSAPTMSSEEGDDGEYLLERIAGISFQNDYPGLGKWPPKRWWRNYLQTFKPAQGAVNTCGMRLPGFLRVVNWPMDGALHYEWYVAIDEDHYNYFQCFAAFPTNPIDRFVKDWWYRLWSGPMRDSRFNNQDKSVVLAQSQYAQRHGGNRPTPLYTPDRYPLAWIDMCNKYARGEGSEYLTRNGEKSAASEQGAAEESERSVR